MLIKKIEKILKGKKKGAAMVEAAMVFPLVILAVLALISILIFFYQVTEARVRMHVALRAESGRLSETVRYGEAPETPCPVYRQGGTVRSRGRLAFLEKGILKSLGKDVCAYKYIYNEREFIRRLDCEGGEAAGRSGL